MHVILCCYQTLKEPVEQLLVILVFNLVYKFVRAQK